MTWSRELPKEVGMYIVYGCIWGNKYREQAIMEVVKTTNDFIYLIKGNFVFKGDLKSFVVKPLELPKLPKGDDFNGITFFEKWNTKKLSNFKEDLKTHINEWYDNFYNCTLQDFLGFNEEEVAYLNSFDLQEKIEKRWRLGE